ncbi:MAG: hypothetical protein JWO35_679 [Candidatus Saccharibacteria bacterium]|nr:hypothetical protein [Candidatus Saccharibacteria bacterium]
MNSTKSFKIGLVLDDGLDKPDGVQQYILGVGEWLRNQGHDVHYLVGESKRTDITGLHSMSRNIMVRFNGNQLTMPLPTSRRKLRKFLDAEQFDVLHIQVPYSPFMGHRLIQAAGPRTAVVGTFHIAPNTGIVTLGTKALGIWLKSSLKRFDDMMSVSPAALNFARATFKVESTISPNVIEYPRFHTAKPFEKYADDTLTILFLGRLVSRKGCHLLLEAVAQLAKQADLPKFRLVICGKGHLEAKLREYAMQQGIEDRVEFTGFVTEEDKPRYYASADISVFPSSGGESFGIVLLEAMASGRAAVLAGDNPGYRSVLHQNPELLFDPQNADALAKKLAIYLRDEALRKQMADWGEDYTKGFDVDVVGRQLQDIYSKALRKRRDQ